MKRLYKIIVITLVICLCFSSAALGETKKNNTIIRLAGTDRYDTAIAAAEHLKEKRSIDTFDKIVLASGIDFPDALSASFLAYKNDAPILLVGKDAVSIEKVTSYINQNLSPGGQVYIIGGNSAVIPEVESAINGKVKRLAGSNRYLTNIKVLEEVGLNGDELLVVSGTNFADALSASAIRKPIFLVGNSLTEDQKAFLKANQNKIGVFFFVIGGYGAVSGPVSYAINECLPSHSFERIDGTDRFHTSLAVAMFFFGDKVENMVVASGMNFPDGLSGGPIAVLYDAPILLEAYYNAGYAGHYFHTHGSNKLIVMGGRDAIPKEVAEYIANPAVEEE